MIRSVLRLLPALALAACSGGGAADAPATDGNPADPAKGAASDTRDTQRMAGRNPVPSSRRPPGPSPHRLRESSTKSAP